MITFLYDTNNNLITDLVRSAILNPDIIKVKNRLLDGTFHVQTIGDRLDTIKVACYTDEANKARLDDMYITNEPIKLVKENKFYVGLMDNKAEWTEFTRGLYETSFDLVVRSEGLI